MATRTDNIVCCGDSGLSVAANVIGILTFVLGAVLTYFAYLILSVNALEDIQTIRGDQTRWREEIDLVIAHCKGEYGQSNPTFLQYDYQLQRGLNRFEEVSSSLTRELNKLPKFNTQSRVPHAFQIRSRVFWAFQRQMAVENLDQLFKIKSDVYSLFISYITQ